MYWTFSPVNRLTGSTGWASNCYLMMELEPAFETLCLFNREEGRCPVFVRSVAHLCHGSLAFVFIIIIIIIIFIIIIIIIIRSLDKGEKLLGVLEPEFPCILLRK
jgi:type II secretory pathway component PulF